MQKGGIEEPRLVIVYDSILSNGKRVELCNKKHFGGVYRGEIDALWEEVLTYLDDRYDLDKVKKVYILGDGANWIKTGLEWIPNSVNVLDGYHLSKAINGIVGKETSHLFIQLCCQCLVMGKNQCRFVDIGNDICHCESLSRPRHT